METSTVETATTPRHLAANAIDAHQRELLLRQTQTSAGLALLEEFASRSLSAPVFLALVLAIVTNTLLVVTMTRNKCFKGYTHYLVGNMALAHFLHAWSQVFVWTIEDYSTSLWKCYAIYSFSNASYLAAQLALLVVVLDRYIAVVRPPFYLSTVNDKFVLAAIASVWSVSVPLSFLPQMGWRPSGLSAVQHCVYYQLMSTSYIRAYHVAAFFAPLLLVILAFLRIYVEMHRRMREIRDQKEYPFYPVPFAKEHKLAKTVAIAALFVLCLALPYHAITLALTSQQHADLIGLYSLALPVYLLHTFFLVIIYYKRSRQFRKAFCRAVCCGCE